MCRVTSLACIFVRVIWISLWAYFVYTALPREPCFHISALPLLIFSFIFLFSIVTPLDNNLLATNILTNSNERCSFWDTNCSLASTDPEHLPHQTQNRCPARLRTVAPPDPEQVPRQTQNRCPARPRTGAPPDPKQVPRQTQNSCPDTCFTCRIK